MSGLREEIARACGVSVDECSFEIVYVEHHLAHVAFSFYTIPFESTVGFTFDAASYFVTTMYASCHGSDIDILDRVYLPNSPGYFYTVLRQFIGFDHIGKEYKVMGLPVYGEPRYMDLMREMLHVTKDGQFESVQKYLKLLDQTFEEIAQDNGEFASPSPYTDRLTERFGPPRARGAEITPRDKMPSSLESRVTEYAGPAS